MTRKEHMEWCKSRALEYIEAGDLHEGITSMLSDLRKHEETENHPGIRLGAMLEMSGQLNTKAKAKKFIEGFN